MMSLLGLLSSTLYLFPQATNLLFRVYDNASASLNLVSRSIFAVDDRITQIDLGIQTQKLKEKEKQRLAGSDDVTTPNPGVWSNILASQLVDLAQAFCLFGDGEQVW